MVKVFKKYYSKFFYKQWGIGVVEEDVADIIRKKKTHLSFKWLHPDNIDTSYADPFVFDKEDGTIEILFEKFTADKYDGEICGISYDSLKGFSTSKTLMKNEFHLSYPFIFYEAGKMYIFPENAFSGSLRCYEYDRLSREFISSKEVCKLPLLDASILKKDNRYWLFATLLGKDKYNKLYLYYADSIFGPYTPHIRNPIKDNLDGSRPAGGFIEVDGDIYRPSQNCKIYYGESITIQKIDVLTTSDYAESEYLKLHVARSDEFSFGIHTINATGQFIVADGLKGYFQPMTRISKMIKRRFAFKSFF